MRPSSTETTEDALIILSSTPMEMSMDDEIISRTFNSYRGICMDGRTMLK
jgi:hypothetical protein